MDTRQLRHFVAVFEQRNLSHAASRSNIAQSALSHHIAKLEAELGVSLFRRKARGMEPTASGVRLYEHATRILRGIKAAETDLRSGSRALAGEIVLGLTFTVVEAIALPLMRTVIDDFPNVRLTLVEGLSEVTFRTLLAGEVDMAMFYNPAASAAIATEALVEEDLMCVGVPAVIGETTAPIAFDEFAMLPNVMLRRGIALRSVLDQPKLLQRLRARTVVEMNSTSGIRKALLGGIGCTIAPHSAMRDLIDSGQLHARPLVDPAPTRQLHLGSQADRLPTRLGEAMRDLICDLVRREVESGAWRGRLLFGPDQVGPK